MKGINILFNYKNEQHLINEKWHKAVFSFCFKNNKNEQDPKDIFIELIIACYQFDCKK